MPMIDLDIAKTKNLINDLKYEKEQALKSKDTKRIRDVDEKYRSTIIKLKTLQSKKASLVQNGGRYRRDGELPWDYPHKPVGPAQLVGGSAVQGVVAKMKGKRKSHHRKKMRRGKK